MASDTQKEPGGVEHGPKGKVGAPENAHVNDEHTSTPSSLSPAFSGDTKIQGVLIGHLAELTGTGEPRVDFAGNLELLPVLARATSELSPADVGRAVALMFEGGDRRKPIIMGLMQQGDIKHDTNATEDPTAQALARSTSDDAVELTLPQANDRQLEPNDIEVDGQRLDLEAKEQIVLRCGKASITLTRAGKVIIRGTYISTRSSGANRIKGGSVQIN